MNRNDLKNISTKQLKERRRVLTEFTIMFSNKYGSNLLDPTFKAITLERRMITHEINSTHC